MLYLPWIGVTSHRVSWMLACVGALVWQRLGARDLRAAIVNNLVCGKAIAGQAQDPTLMNIVAGWLHSQNAAAMQTYFSNIAASGPLGPLVWLHLFQSCVEKRIPSAFTLRAQACIDIFATLSLRYVW